MEEEERDEEYFAGVLQQWLDTYQDDPDIMEELQQFVREDRISGLPLDILVHILSLLDTKDAVQTSILSHHWRYIWLRIPDIKLDLCNIFGSDYNIGKLSNHEAVKDFQIQFMNRANCVIEQYKRRGPSTLRSLKVDFFLDVQSPVSSSLDKWVRYAIQARAEKIELLLSSISTRDKNYFVPIQMYEVPDLLFSETSINWSALKHMSLQGCLLDHYQGDFGGLRNLTSLKLELVVIEGDFMTPLLSTALLLRDLTLESCIFIGRNFHLVGSSVIHLKLLSCGRLADIKISSPKLTTLGFAGQASLLSLFEAPSLSTLTFSSSDSNHHLNLLSSLPQLEKLTLFIDKPKVEAISKSMNVSFKSVSLLVLLLETYEVGDLSWFPTILKSSPVLQKLVLQLQFPLSKYVKVTQKKLEMKKPERFIHKQLKDVEIGGCHGFWFEIEIVKFLFKVAVNLERMVIGPKKRVFGTSGEWVDATNVDNSAWYNSERDILLGRTQNRVPAGVQLTVL